MFKYVSSENAIASQTVLCWLGLNLNCRASDMRADNFLCYLNFAHVLTIVLPFDDLDLDSFMVLARLLR